MLTVLDLVLLAILWGLIASKFPDLAIKVQGRKSKFQWIEISLLTLLKKLEDVEFEEWSTSTLFPTGLGMNTMLLLLSNLINRYNGENGTFG